MPKQVEQGKNWYVLHTYSGYEEAVARNLNSVLNHWGWKVKSLMF